MDQEIHIYIKEVKMWNILVYVNNLKMFRWKNMIIYTVYFFLQKVDSLIDDVFMTEEQFVSLSLADASFRS